MRNTLSLCIVVCGAMTLCGCDQKKTTNKEVAVNSSHTGVPCDFKGLSVGDKMTPDQVMDALGVAKWRLNPTKPSFGEKMSIVEKFGLIPAGEIEDWNLGPYCENGSCEIPYGLTVGNRSIPVSVHVALPNGMVTEVDVSFAASEWDEILPIVKGKYGESWNTENDPMMLITDWETKKTTQVDRVTLTHKMGGRNETTGDKCEIWATNYDIIETHHDPLGMYHSNFVIKLVSKNF